MNQGDALVFAVGATMALILANRASRRSQLSFRVKASMALAWVALIVVGAAIAAWRQR